jgi:hypothetical protein
MLHVNIQIDYIFDLARPALRPSVYTGRIMLGERVIHEFRDEGGADEAQACAAYWICTQILNGENPALAHHVRQFLSRPEHSDENRAA